MKQPLMILCALVLLLVGCENLSVQDGEIKIYHSLPVVPHGSETYRYVIRGKSYSGVSSEYLRIPEKRIVVFGTETLGGKDLLQVVPLDRSEGAFSVKLDSPGPGVWAFPLGLGRPTSDTASTLVESIQGDSICFVTTMFSYKGKVWHTYLDLKNRTLSQIKAVDK